ncbi:MAG: hypothetical protein Q9163_002421 [Psora crenata]
MVVSWTQKYPLQSHCRSYSAKSSSFSPYGDSIVAIEKSTIKKVGEDLASASGLPPPSSSPYAHRPDLKDPYKD